MTSHDEGPRTSKPSSLFEEPNNRIFRGYCGVKELSNPDPLHIGPNAHAEEEETLEDEQRESLSCQEILPRTIMSLANRNRKKEERHTFKDSFPSRGVQKIHQPAKPNPTQPNPTRRVGSVFKAWWVGLQKNFL